MLHHILFVLWLFLPAGMANVTPVIAVKVPSLKAWSAPIDGGLTFRGKRLLGANKTWRGLVCGVLVAVLVIYLQQVAYQHFDSVRFIANGLNYSRLPIIALGGLLGFGALAGDAIESFVKRQYNILPGTAWFPFDQTDYIFGGALLALPIVRLMPEDYIWLIVVWLIMHLLFSYIGYLFKLKPKPI